MNRRSAGGSLLAMGTAGVLLYILLALAKAGAPGRPGEILLYLSLVALAAGMAVWSTARIRNL